MNAIVELTPADVRHRRQFRDFCIREAIPWHREVLGRLYDLWEHWNSDHFEGLLVPPYLLLAEPRHPQALGDCSNYSGFGGKSQVRLASLLTGRHPLVHAGEQFTEGRFLIVADVLLHETVHQWHFEITGQSEATQGGHGPAFRDVCNRIGAALGLPPVRTGKARGKDKDLPSCAHWPHCVRPADHYIGALVQASSDVDGQDQGSGEECGQDDGRERRQALEGLLDAARSYSRQKTTAAQQALLDAAEQFTQAEQ